MNNEKFLKYENVRLSGATNMWDTNRVSELSGLDKEEVINIMKNYGKYKEISEEIGGI